MEKLLDNTTSGPNDIPVYLLILWPKYSYGLFKNSNIIKYSIFNCKS